MGRRIFSYCTHYQANGKPKVADSGITWNPPQWSDHGEKHFPELSVSWDRVVKGTGEGKQIAKYHSRLSKQQIQSMELKAITNNQREIPQTKPNTRAFWDKVSDEEFPIGASSGRETAYIYVEYNSSGPVHGRPITEAQLRQKGVTL